MKKIYLDYAATTPVDKKVLKAMLPYFGEKYGNASSIHNFGREASVAVEKARKLAADFFGAQPREIIFTSGATESNNLAIKGAVKAYWADKNNNKKPHIIATSIEHHSILDVCESLKRDKLAEITLVDPQKNGVVKISDIEKALKPNTILVSVMYVNNEIGTVQPIVELGKIIKRYNPKILFQTDATQAVNYFDCDVNRLGVDLMSLSAHKIYGPKGAGVLYIRNSVAVKRIQDGGGQERNLRAGTINTPGIVGLGAAIKEIKNSKFKIKNGKIGELRDYLIGRVLKEIPKVRLNGSKIRRSPNNANFTFQNVEGESLIILLSQAGIAVSTGSACSSGSLNPSHVLLAIGLKPEQTHGSLRITLGKYTTKEEIDYATDKLKIIIDKLRRVSGNVLDEYYHKH